MQFVTFIAAILGYDSIELFTLACTEKIAEISARIEMERLCWCVTERIQRLSKFESRISKHKRCLPFAIFHKLSLILMLVT